MKKRSFYIDDNDMNKLKAITKSYFNISDKLMSEGLRKLINEKYATLKKNDTK